MIKRASDLLAPRILVVDDERPVLTSVKLRVGKQYDLTCCTDPREALERVKAREFDLCLTDIQMPQMNGLSFIAAAREADPELGYVILSAFDTDENLRRSIPLQVYEFLPKPLPERDGFEDRIPEWVERTRRRRREHHLAEKAGSIARDLDDAHVEREVELVASATARDALLQTAGLLTTIHAHLLASLSVLAPRSKGDAVVAHLVRGLDEARKTADAAISVGEGFFNYSYGNRDGSPALPATGLRHAANIAARMCRADRDRKQFDFIGVEDRVPIRNISGIEFILMTVPILAAAFTLADSQSIIRIAGEYHPKLEVIAGEHRFRHYLWVNRRTALLPRPGLLMLVTCSAPAFTRVQAEAWLNSEYDALATVTPRGLVRGIEKCRALLGLAILPETAEFSIALLLPT